MRLRFLGALGAVLGAVVAAPSLAATQLSEAEGVRRVCTLGPQHARARAERQRGDAEQEAARVWANPSLVVEHQQTLDGPRDRETVVGAAFPVSLSGRRSLLSDAAAARAEEANWRASARLFEAALLSRGVRHRLD